MRHSWICDCVTTRVYYCSQGNLTAACWRDTLPSLPLDNVPLLTPLGRKKQGCSVLAFEAILPFFRVAELESFAGLRLILLAFSFFVHTLYSNAAYLLRRDSPSLARA